MDFGTRLAEKRKEKGFTQDDLEKATGINKRLISRYEKNDTMPSIDVARKLAGALEVSLDYLTGLDYSLFINDPEMTRLLKGYEQLKDEDKHIIKKMLKAFSFYSKIEETQSNLA
ncbi:MAG: helix-turn-helix domain-containing protein [Cytophagales bacterium]|nr:helix-turn-helix domain-containing protein [Cytophagales bacterium]